MPAEALLSPEGWANPHDVLDGLIDLDVGIVDVSLGGAGGSSRDVDRDRLALGAYLLRGYLTWADLDACRDTPAVVNLTDLNREDALRSLADRIAALLPPREQPPP